MTMAGWRSRGFRPEPSENLASTAPTPGEKMDSLKLASASSQMRLKGLERKNVAAPKKSTFKAAIRKDQASSRRRREIRAMKRQRLTIQVQKKSEPAWPPQSAVILRIRGC